MSILPRIAVKVMWTHLYVGGSQRHAYGPHSLQRRLSLPTYPLRQEMLLAFRKRLPVLAVTAHNTVYRIPLCKTISSSYISPTCNLSFLSYTRAHFGMHTGSGFCYCRIYISLTRLETSVREGDADIQPQVGGSLLPIGGHDVSPLLLLSMFATAARYSASSEPLSTSSTSPMAMWTAGDEYLVQAKTLLDKTYTAPRASTVQALLLLGYRELGIGSMAQAWMYTGMAVRMAQDLGMHRAADAWARVGLEKLFGAQELQSRRCIWWGCVVLDVYVSAYIGRPLAITDRDYDTQLPTPDEVGSPSLSLCFPNLALWK